MVIWVYPSFEAEVDLDQLLAAYPEPVLQVMGVQTMASLGGFLSFELYTFGWIILLGLYLAYATAGRSPTMSIAVAWTSCCRCRSLDLEWSPSASPR